EMIIDLNPGTLEALFDARLIIETGVAALAATHIDDAELARLARNVEDEARLLSDPAAFSAADVEFHEAIIEACNNPFLQSVAGSL
ncbi:FCD domain-containing protein, partial [Acinetobacter baumannii]